ncbi:MAG: hypothetical protein RLZZ627_972 [Pseudomonadota bacterium]|jgi:hypothetical protein
MQKFFFYALFLLLLPLSVLASSWDQVAQVPGSGTTYYIDHARITKTAKGWKVWAIVDDESPDPKLHTLSLSYLLEVNCEENKEQYSSLAGYAGHMANGDILFSYAEPSEWFDVKANTVVDDRLQAICRIAPDLIRQYSGR